MPDETAAVKPSMPPELQLIVWLTLCYEIAAAWGYVPQCAQRPA
jgi:hypothetical protein